MAAPSKIKLINLKTNKTHSNPKPDENYVHPESMEDMNLAEIRNPHKWIWAKAYDSSTPCPRREEQGIAITAIKWNHQQLHNTYNAYHCFLMKVALEHTYYPDANSDRFTVSYEYQPEAKLKDPIKCLDFVQREQCHIHSQAIWRSKGIGNRDLLRIYKGL